MDWNDPWAADNDPDDGNKSPTKPTPITAVANTTANTTATATAITTSPFVVNDVNVWDSPWGSNEDDGFGGWASEVAMVDAARVEEVAEKQTSWGDVDNAATKEDGLVTRKSEDVLPESNAWNGFKEDVEEQKESETSEDSTTTMQPEDAAVPVTMNSTDSIHRDDDHSTRPSMSPSDVSHNETATDSPRTSFEEERAAAKAPAVKEERTGHDEDETKDNVEEEQETTPEPAETEEVDEFGDFQQDILQQSGPSQLHIGSVEQTPVSPGWGAASHVQSNKEDVELPPAPSIPLNIGPHRFDSDLMSQLFTPAEEVQASEREEAPDDPIHSTSGTRKAWYRLTRKQTLREYNSGLDYDSYIRVNWKTSHVRGEVNKVVTRWATEDRMAGRGPGARASFYWDTPVPKDQKTVFHPRNKSTVSVPVMQSVQPTKTDIPAQAPAAFDWSSSPATGADPWKDEMHGTRSTPSPVSPPQHNAVAKLQWQEGRGGSLDLTPRSREPTTHKRNATSVDVLRENMPTRSISPVLPPPPKPSTRTSEDANPSDGLDALDTNPPTRLEATTKVDDDDHDDWGDMVESPTVSTTHTSLPLADFSEPPTRDNTLSTPATTPKSIESSPLQAHAIGSKSKHASPIVRLKGIVSPTSARFKANASVPAGVEEGRIGPGILKARNASAESTLDKSRTPQRTIAPLDKMLHIATRSGSPKTTSHEDPNNMDNGFFAFEPSISEPAVRSPTPPRAPASPTPPVQDSSAAWGDDADFSMFESSTPVANPPPPPPLPQQTDLSNPWSIFDAPAPPPLEPAEPYTPPPPRAVTPLAKRPLTGATSSAQRRKMEEDETIRDILERLPDLRYMLTQ